MADCRYVLAGAFPRPQLSEIEIARARFANASAAAQGALNGLVNLHVERDQGQDVTVSLELNEELPQDDAGKEEMKRQFIAEIAAALGVPVEMLADVEFIDSGEEQQRVVAREWLTKLLTESVRGAAATMEDWEDAAQRRKEARATVSAQANRTTTRFAGMGPERLVVVAGGADGGFGCRGAGADEEADDKVGDQSVQGCGIKGERCDPPREEESSGEDETHS